MAQQTGQSGSVAIADIAQLAINTIRTLSMDAVQAANCGHPGAPMGMAPTAYVLWQRLLRYDPADPIWPNRDRFVLSAGHASMLLYSVLHLAGVKAVGNDYRLLPEPAVSLDEIKRFRQFGSKTPGHPEYRLTSGVETTTGPLGQGAANSVGIAMAARWLAEHYNRPEATLFDYNVYALCGDGCMMEGISSEAASLAGHLKLSNLCWIYDSNRITIEGKTSLAFDEDTGSRFEAYGWNVIKVGDANNLDEIEQALRGFQKTADRPTLVIVPSHIAWGAPHLQDSHKAHGEPLGEEEIKLTKRAYGWPEDAKFLVPDGVYQHFQEGIGRRGGKLRKAWQTTFAKYKAEHPDLAGQIDQMQHRELPPGWDKDIPSFPADPKGKATRDSSGQVLNAIAKNVPWLIGGAADLAPSTKTLLTFDGAGQFQAASYGGRNLHFGVREHAMGAIVNGLAVSKLRAYGATFLVFSDYMRNTLRLAAIMEIPSIFIYTHDSIGVGEDGPTHQPIEHIPSLRAIPGFVTLRPCDANEVVEAWKFIMPQRHQPVALVLTRQALPTLDRSKYALAEGLQRGAYVLAEAPGGKPAAILLATGSEVSLVIAAHEQLATEGIPTRVVSLPSFELFEHYCRKHPEYRESVLPSSVTARVAVEMAATFGWDRYVGFSGQVIGMHSFGASSPLKDLQKHFGFTVEAVVAAIKAQIAATKS
ncbi:MAG: transketolase [Planctomycetaceae bacterium]|nr:transketolase [Planctomycetaceae bacterium]